MYQEITLENGLRIVHEKMPHVRSAAVGIWIGVGSRYEKAAQGGSAHFIEHMLFKGTDKHTAESLAQEMDAIGGQINAFTTRESTCFYARVLDSHLNTAIELLGDMFFNSKLLQEDVENERGIILEEIDMYDDSPDDLVVDRLFEKVFKGSLGRPILGKPSTLGKMTGDSLRQFMEDEYLPSRVVIALCGSFEEDHLKKISDLFAVMPKKKAKAPSKSGYVSTLCVKRKATEQNHLCLAFPGMASNNEDRFTMQLLINILGGGMSSRLFQTVREKYGLCYSVYAFSSSFKDAGMLGIATALGKDTEEKALRLIFDEINKLLQDGVDEDELYRAREQIKSNLVMTMESTSSRMNKIGSGVLLLGRSMDTDDLIAKYDAVARDDISRVAAELLTPELMSFSAVGRVSGADEYREILKAF